MISQPEQLPLVINQEVFNKIKFLCNKINKVEWSGVLFYKINGSIRTPSEFSIEIADILLMDKGTSGYTEYNFDESVAEFIMDKAMEDPTWMTIKIGHIHSHNTMGVFFSSTDMEELFDNCGNHNFYLSLIVNNFEEMIAKLVYRGISNQYTVKDEQGESYSIPYQDNTSESVLFSHDCTIEKPDNSIVVEESFKERLTKVLTLSEERAKLKEQERLKKLALQTKPIVNKHSPYNQHLFAKKNSPDSAKDIFSRMAFDQNVSPLVTRTELFHCFVLRLGEEVSGDDIFNALESVGISDLPEDITSRIINNFSDYYSRFYKENKDFVMEDFLLSIEVFVDDLSDYEDRFNFVPTLIKGLQNFGNALEARWEKEEADREELEELETENFNNSFKQY